MSMVTRWRLPLRLARRDAMRAKGRSILVLVMIALPVLAVTAAAVTLATQDVDSAESLDRRLGAAAAKVAVEPGVSRVFQGPDPDETSATEYDPKTVPLTEVQVAEALGGRRLVELRTESVSVTTERGKVDAEATEVDLEDPLAAGLFELSSGHWPDDASEVVVNQALLDKGYAVGDLLETPGDDVPDPTIVGVAESASIRTYPVAAGPLGSLTTAAATTEHQRTWLVDGGPVSWSQVLALNGEGAAVLSRAVVLDPPPLPPELEEYLATSNADWVAVVVLVVVMALIEVVLLAGPAFAVGARRQSRSLALLSATGGTPVQSRRVVLASAVVLGGIAAALGVVLGVLIALVTVPVLQSRSDSWFGPFEMPWMYVGAIAAFGLLSAFLAAVVPAHIASRQDVVALLAGRRGDRAPSLRSPILGLVLLGVGIAGSVVGATGGGEILIAASAIPAVLGMILLIPLVLAFLGRLARRLPLVMRYAARDAARHRTRTVPAVAAVAATVAGVVALGIGVTSDAAESEATYEASLVDGTGAVTGYGADVDWTVVARVVERELPEARVAEIRGLDEEDETAGLSSFIEFLGEQDSPLLTGWSSSAGASVLVSDREVPAVLVGVSADSRRAAGEALASGRMVAFTDQVVADGPEVQLTARIATYDMETGEDSTRRVKVDALLVPMDAELAGAQAVVPTSVARQLEAPVTTVGLSVDGAEISSDVEAAINEEIAGITDQASFYVERGYQPDDETVIIQLVLLALGAVLMLGGTLTATFLALSDARPDLATLSAVGAAPRTRRGVAAAYAVVVGFVGALLGAAVGFIPGIAITYPLTTQSGESCVIEGSGACTVTEVPLGPFIDVPWLMILSLVIGLPLVTALIVGLFARSRLPLVARLD